MLSEGKVPEEYEFDVGSNLPTRNLPSSANNTPSENALCYDTIWCEQIIRLIEGGYESWH